MGSTTDRIKGLANEAIGNAKQGIGQVTGDAKLKADGKAQEIKGEGQQAMADTKDAVKDTANRAADAINRKL
ncbi:CsbD family protein [Nostoc sp. NIES-2111]